MHLVPRRLSLAATALALALAVAGSPAMAQYRWKDSHGQLHASDRPPPQDIPDKDVLQRPVPRPLLAPQPAASAASAPAVARARAPVDPELEQRRVRAEQEAKARAQVEEQRAAAQRAENCQRARQHLATLENGARLVRFNDKGERIVLDDAARAGEVAQARSVMARDCR